MDHKCSVLFIATMDCISLTHENGTTFLIPRDSAHEIDEHLYIRGWFIVKRLPKTEEEFIKLQQLSIYYLNTIIYKCRYDDLIMSQLE